VDSAVSIGPACSQHFDRLLLESRLSPKEFPPHAAAWSNPSSSTSAHLISPSTRAFNRRDRGSYKFVPRTAASYHGDAVSCVLPIRVVDAGRRLVSRRPGRRLRGCFRKLTKCKRNAACDNCHHCHPAQLPRYSRPARCWSRPIMRSRRGQRRRSVALPAAPTINHTLHSNLLEDTFVPRRKISGISGYRPSSNTRGRITLHPCMAGGKEHSGRDRNLVHRSNLSSPGLGILPVPTWATGRRSRLGSSSRLSSAVHLTHKLPVGLEVHRHLISEIYIMGPGEAACSIHERLRGRTWVCEQRIGQYQVDVCHHFLSRRQSLASLPPGYSSKTWIVGVAKVHGAFSCD
jgi:hypothetical protein